MKRLLDGTSGGSAPHARRGRNEAAMDQRIDSTMAGMSAQAVTTIA